MTVRQRQAVVFAVLEWSCCLLDSPGTEQSLTYARLCARSPERQRSSTPASHRGIAHEAPSWTITPAAAGDRASGSPSSRRCRVAPQRGRSRARPPVTFPASSVGTATAVPRSPWYCGCSGSVSSEAPIRTRSPSRIGVIVQTPAWGRFRLTPVHSQPHISHG